MSQRLEVGDYVEFKEKIYYVAGDANENRGLKKDWDYILIDQSNQEWCRFQASDLVTAKKIEISRSRK